MGHNTVSIVLAGSIREIRQEMGLRRFASPAANGLLLRSTRASNRMWRVPLKKKLELFIMLFVGLCNTRL